MSISLFLSLNVNTSNVIPPSFTGYNADYLLGVKDWPWTPALPENVAGDPATWSISPGLPAGLSIDSGTGEISGTPTATASGTYTITASNDGGSAQQNVTLNVSAATFVEWNTPGIHTWKFLNGVNNAFNRLQIASGGGGGAHTVNGENRYSGGGGGCGRHYTNLDYETIFANQILPGTNVTITIGAGGDGSFNQNDPGGDGESSIFEIDGFSAFLISGGGGAPDPEANNDAAGGIAGGGNNGLAGFPGDINGDPELGQKGNGGCGAYGISGDYGSDPYGVNSAATLYQSGPDYYYNYLTVAGSGYNGTGGGGGGWAWITSFLLGFGAGNPSNYGDGAPGADGYCKLDWNPVLDPMEYWKAFF